MAGQNIYIKFLLLVVLCGRAVFCHAQTPTDSIPFDPGGLRVFTLQNLSFGTFSHGNTGGTVVISPEGIRTATGDVMLLNMGEPFFHAIFEFEAPPGAIISVYNGPDTYLTGSNGGSVKLTIGGSNPATPFITTIPPPGRTQISFGATLTVGGALGTVPGTYTGNFYITFNQE
jgi:hypothetical protein